MDQLRHFQKQFAYNAWANEETIVSLRKAGEAPARSLAILAHLVSAEWLWLERLKGERQSYEVWPAWTLAESEVHATKIPPLWQQYLGRLKPASLAAAVGYRNTKGETWSNSVGDILTHALLHSSYHRGQIATDVRASGHAPAYTDYIHAVRQGLVR